MKNVEECVYHYCSVNTFYSILSNQTLRLSDVTKSNDYYEIIWVKNKIIDLFKIHYDDLADHIKEKIPINEYCCKIQEKVELFFEENEVSDKFYTMCFSGGKSGDLLSQWRGYGDDGRGIAIGFNVNFLKKMKDSIQIYEERMPRVLFQEIEYNEEKQEDTMGNIIKIFLDRLNMEEKCLIGIDNEFEHVLLMCFRRIYQQAIFMKNSFFIEENESRLVIDIAETSEAIEGKQLKENMFVSDKKFYVRNNEIVSYYEIDWKNSEKAKKELINKIILGPKCRVGKETLDAFAKSKGINIGYIQKSKGSYR